VQNSNVQNEVTQHNLRRRTQPIIDHQAEKQHLDQNVESNVHEDIQILPSQQSDIRHVSNFQNPTDIEFENNDFKLFIEKGTEIIIVFSGSERSIPTV
jgi:hypothetical protein